LVRSEEDPDKMVKGDIMTLEEFGEKEEVILLSDGNVFNVNALANWFKTRKTRGHPLNPRYVATDTELEELGLTPEDVDPNAGEGARLFQQYWQENMMSAAPPRGPMSREQLITALSEYRLDDIVESDLQAQENDSEIFLLAVSQDGNLLASASELLKDDDSLVLAAVQNDGGALKFASPRLQDTHSIVSAAIQSDHEAFQYAGPAMKNDYEIAEFVVKTDPSLLQFASEDLRNNFALVEAALDANRFRLHYVVLQHAGESVVARRWIVMEAVKQTGQSLRYASATLQNDEQVVFEAVRQDGTALQYASERLRDDWYIVNTAVGQDWKAINFAPANFQKLAGQLRYYELLRPAERVSTRARLPKVGKRGAFWNSGPTRIEDPRFSWN
jgi:hypothetical protein